MWSLVDYFQDEIQIDIVDIGASNNSNAPPPYQPLVDAGKARIIGFEPNQEECTTLNIEYGKPHQFFPYFIGDGQPATFHETNWVLTGSLFEPNTPLLEKFQNLAELVTPVATHPVSTTKIDDIAEITNIDFFKIDIQGGELAVFQNALKVLSETLVIQTEVEFLELYKGQPLFADVDTFLRSQGFKFHTFDGFGRRAFKPLLVDNNVNQGLRQDLWSDAIYVRDWINLESLSAGKLQKYAIILHDIVRSYDLAHFVLTALDKKTGTDLAKKYLSQLSSQPVIRI
jgi:FkbM family methyltransferase